MPENKAQEVEKEKKGAKAAMKEKEKEKKVDKVEKEKKHEKKVEKKGEKKVEKKLEKKGEKQKEQEDAFDSMLEGIVGGDSDSEKSHCSESTLELGKQSEEEEGGGCDEESESEQNEDEQESSEMEEEESAAESSEEEAEAEEVTTKKRRKEEKAPKTAETEDKKGDKGKAIAEAANRAAEGAARANSVSHKKEWDTFSRQCNDRKKCPVGLAEYVNTRKTDLFQLWLENNQNLHESKPQLFSKPCWNPCITIQNPEEKISFLLKVATG